MLPKQALEIMSADKLFKSLSISMTVIRPLDFACPLKRVGKKRKKKKRWIVLLIKRQTVFVYKKFSKS